MAGSAIFARRIAILDVLSNGWSKDELN
jgi:hypothetical protein